MTCLKMIKWFKGLQHEVHELKSEEIAFALEELMGSFHSTSRCIPSFVFPVLTFAYLVSLSILSAISVERCLSVLWPIWYCCHHPRHTLALQVRTPCSSSQM
ncbi:Mas-related G-protein coupled receptor member X1 [Manis javanica]|nr:Mas-related G-protein coupled receptor member X1 [Manis javanica]